MKTLAKESLRRPRPEPRTPEELALALRTPALRAAIAKRKANKK